MKYPRNKSARHAIQFVENLHLIDDYHGEPVKLRPWQKHIVGSIFGTIDKTTRRRAIKKVLLMLPRKQGKTYITACVVLYCLLGLRAHGQYIVSAANSQKQAGILFDSIRKIIAQDPLLNMLATITPSTKNIAVIDKGSSYQAMASDKRTALGWNPSVVIIDEFQEFTSPKAIDLHDNLITSFGARRDRLTIKIMTGGTDRRSLAYDEFQYAKKVRDGIIKDPTYLPILFCADEDDDWNDEAVWRKAMPALGDFVSEDFIREEYQQAKLLPTRERSFRQYYLNQYVQPDTAWVSDDKWMGNDTKPDGSTEITYTAGLDIASVEDTSALVLYGRRADGLYDVIPFYWIAEGQIRKRKTTDYDYPQWVKDGHMRTMPGEAQDPEVIYEDILEICQQYRVEKLAVDRWGTHYIANRLVDAGLDVIYYGQGFKDQSEPIKTLQRQILSKQLAHGGHPVLRWNVSNCRVEQDRAENYRLSKDKSSEKIDGVAALVSACGIYEEDVYEESGDLFVL